MGAVLGHWLGAQFGRPILGKFVSESRIRSAEALFDKYGVWAVLVAAVTPIPYKVFTILAGVLKLAGTHAEANTGLIDVGVATNAMGQELFNPPTVEGWHTGQEWIDSGTLMERINYASSRLGDINKPGVRFIADRLAADQRILSPRELVDGCLQFIGCHRVSDITRESLESYASQIDGHDPSTDSGRESFDVSVANMLRLIVSTPDFQKA